MRKEIAEVCINYGYDFQKEEVVDKENFEDIKIEDDEKDLQEIIAFWKYHKRSKQD